jgi:hypothetical protein
MSGFVLRCLGVMFYHLCTSWLSIFIIVHKHVHNMDNIKFSRVCLRSRVVSSIWRPCNLFLFVDKGMVTFTASERNEHAAVTYSKGLSFNCHVVFSYE